MPFYIRARQQDIPTPTISSVGSDDEDNFITDPEKIFDELPQPFRLINKIVNEIFEASWDNISALEIERELEAKRVRPPTYTPSSAFEKFQNVSCMCSTDSNLLFLGLENSLVVINNDTLEMICSWSPEEGICVDRIMCSYHQTSDLYLLAIIDDMGFARLLVLENDTFHFVAILNELLEGSPKSNATKFEISADGQYCSVALESEKVCWIEFYKIPIENWTKEIETGRKEYLKKVESMTATSTSDMSVENDLTKESSSELAFPEIKYSPLSLVLKVNQPLPIKGTNAKTAQQMLDQINSGDVIGDGTFHGVTDTSFVIQEKLFAHLNERDLMFSEDEIVTETNYPSFYFLKKSCMEPSIQGKVDSIYTHVGIWFSHHHNFYIYQLNKGGKNIEFRPDSVWPQSSNITCCVLANSTMLLAIGVEKGSLTLWDRNMGLVKHVVSICNTVAITRISFLNMMDNGVNNNQHMAENVQLLVGCANGQISKICCEKEKKPLIVVPAASTQENSFALIKPIPNLSQVFLIVLQDGNMLLRSTDRDEIYCNLSLPVDYKFENPFETGILLDPNGEVLHVRGSKLLSNDNDIFLFHLRSFPTLDKIRASQEEEQYDKPTKFNDVIQNLLTQRMQKQAARTSILASRWHNLHKQLNIVLNLKETMLMSKKEAQYSQSSSPASHWSRTTTKIIAHNKDLKT
uniref:WD repeat-containing protein 93-like n=1 Tax=Styela clava TaxID=7725 RepID=UPI00193A6C31|nr:WD repeat-containing protein 93-like [Styela clava]